MAPAVLIVNEWWGQAIHGGSSAAARLIIRLVHSLGFKVYCTVLHSNTQTDAEARELGVDKLVLPDPQGRLRSRKPHSDWLLTHEVYFPDLNALEEVKVVFGFGLVTSDAALRIRNTVYPTAKFFLVNVLTLKEATPKSLGHDVDEFMVRCELLVEESKAADAIFSFGLKTYDCFQSRYDDDFKEKHYRLVPIPEPMFFAIKNKARIHPDGTGDIVILTALQGDDMRELDSHFVLAQSINKVARTYCEEHNRVLTWKILGVPAAKEDYVRSILRPHPLVNLFPLAANIYENLIQQLNKAHLVLIPPRSALSMQFAFTAMAAGVPTFVPKGWEYQSMFLEHFESFEANAVVTMSTSSNALKKKIISVIENYGLALYTALNVKYYLEQALGHDLAQENGDFLAMTYSVMGQEKLDSEKCTDICFDLLTEKIGLTERWSIPKRQPRTFGEIAVRVRTKGGVPIQGRTMAEVDNDLYGMMNETEPQNEADIQALLEEKKKPGCGGITFILECLSLDALDCLWNEYQTETLLKMTEGTLLSGSVQREYGVNHIRLRVHIDYEEYHTCKKELREKQEKEAREARIAMARMDH